MFAGDHRWLAFLMQSAPGHVNLLLCSVARVQQRRLPLPAIRLAGGGRMLNKRDLPTWVHDALEGVVLGGLIFVGLALLAGGSLVLVQWL